MQPMINDDEEDSSGDQPILDDAQDFLRSRIEAESKQRLLAIDDLNFVAASMQWPDDVRMTREADRRPCLTINKLATFVHQVTNDLRQNRPSIKVHPVDDEADEETADVMQGLIRHIEYTSNADVARDTAVSSAAKIGFGYYRLITEYSKEDSFDQDIKYKRIRNAFTVYLGPHIEPDGSDMMKAMITEELAKSEFKRQYPDANCDDQIQRGPGDSLAQWLGKDKVRVAEFYRVETMAATLVQLEDGTAGWADSLQPHQVPAVDETTGEPKTRKSMRRKVAWYKVTGTQVLERTEIPCNWIPVFPVYGDEDDVDGEIIRAGLVRNAKDPARMYNVWMTAATEEIGMRPKAPYIGAEGQFEDHEDKWDHANVRNWPYMEYKPVTIDGNLAPPPARQPMADVPQGVLAMAMHASDDIKATTGLFDASLGARGNETSGRAIIARQKEGDVSNFHFADGLTRTIRHEARCLVWMIPRVYDTQRMVRVLGEDEDVQHVTINRPKTPQEVQQEQQKQAQLPPNKQQIAIKTIANDMTVGEYDITVGSGPSYSTLRQETADAMIQVGQSWPKLWDIAGDKLVKSLDWHGADEIAERIKKTIPPQILGENEPDVAELTGQLQQKDGQIQQLSQALEQAHQEHQETEQQLASGIDKQKVQTSGAVQIAEINADAKRDVEEIRGLVQQVLLHMKALPQFVEASLEADSGRTDGETAVLPDSQGQGQPLAG